MNESKIVARLVLPGKTIEFDNDDEITIGKLKELSIVLDDPSVHIFHAVITPFSAGFKIRDILSETGTFVNDKRVRGGLAKLVTSSCALRFGNVKGELIIPPELTNTFKRNLKALKESGWKLNALPSYIDPEYVRKEFLKHPGPMDIDKLMKLFLEPSPSAST